jgi:hypothetical protein
MWGQTSEASFVKVAEETTLEARNGGTYKTVAKGSMQNGNNKRTKHRSISLSFSSVSPRALPYELRQAGAKP